MTRKFEPIILPPKNSYTAQKKNQGTNLRITAAVRRLKDKKGATHMTINKVTTSQATKSRYMVALQNNPRVK